MDECAGPSVARWLYLQEHEVISVAPDYPGLNDLAILQWAVAEDRIVVTCDKGFGELVFHRGEPHRGVILLRMQDQSPEVKVEMLQYLMEQTIPLLSDNFVVVNEEKSSFNRSRFSHRRAGGNRPPRQGRQPHRR